MTAVVSAARMKQLSNSGQDLLLPDKWQSFRSVLSLRHIRCYCLCRQLLNHMIFISVQIIGAKLVTGQLSVSHGKYLSLLMFLTLACKPARQQQLTSGNSLKCTVSYLYLIMGNTSAGIRQDGGGKTERLGTNGKA